MNIDELIAEKDALMRGATRPAKVFEVVPDGRGGYTHREVDPAKIQTQFRKEWVAEVRTNLGLSQSHFAAMLGISKRTVQEWEQGRSVPSGPAKKLLRVASINPEAVLDEDISLAGILQNRLGERGGARPGARCKPSGQDQYVTSLSQDLISWVKDEAQRGGVAECYVIELALLNAKDSEKTAQKRVLPARSHYVKLKSKNLLVTKADTGKVISPGKSRRKTHRKVERQSSAQTPRTASGPLSTPTSGRT